MSFGLPVSDAVAPGCSEFGSSSEMGAPLPLLIMGALLCCEMADYHPDGSDHDHRAWPACQWFKDFSVDQALGLWTLFVANTSRQLREDKVSHTC